MSHNFILSALALTLTVASCGQPKDVEVGPYTVSTIEKNVWHIQDYNKSNPAGETFDAEGNKTHFNSCSDIYLLVGEKEALVIDLSNPTSWGANAGTAQSSAERKSFSTIPYFWKSMSAMFSFTFCDTSSSLNPQLPMRMFSCSPVMISVAGFFI